MDNSQEMISVCGEKCLFYNTPQIKPILFDLEHLNYQDSFDIIYSQMVLHHVHEVDLLLNKFYTMLNPGGILVIADLYSEDGSFHDSGVDVHKGFDPDKLLDVLEGKGFSKGQYSQCYHVKRSNGREYPVFLLWASM
jgi:ubiquinone/menaquinone biosynthesis C-methylase UbiE